ncbi:hypothetical protein MKX03_015084 [Papaver bracteatum]|nr:hypothetical protein MKX03_015084 [Papaver bracteatum]
MLLPRQAQTSSLFDVPIQLQTQLNHGASSCVFAQTIDENFFDVTIEEDFMVDVPVQLLQIFDVPFSSTSSGNRPRQEESDPLLSPHGTFNTSASTSSTGKKQRLSRSRHVSYTPITLLRSPKI